MIIKNTIQNFSIYEITKYKIDQKKKNNGSPKE